MQGRFPVVFLFLKMDAALVDVNVHPTKIEVRFRNSNQVFQVVRDAIQETLRGQAAPTIPPPLRPAPAEGKGEAAKTAPPVAPSAPPSAFTGLDGQPKPREESIRRAMADFFSKSHARPIAPTQASPPRQPVAAAPAPSPTIPKAVAPAQIISRRGKAFQIHNAYIVEETEEGIQITDQHALHERILREALEPQLKNARVLSQRLLMPATVQLTPREFLAVMELRETLARLGVDITDFGQNTIAIHAMPQILGRCDPGQFVRDILDELGEGRDQPTLDQKLDRIINLAACKGAVKAGQPLTPEEIRSLLEQRERLNHPSVCAHGRPSTILLTFEYLQKQFARK
jgi:DNA mismatch repair protein MutL